MSLEGECFCRAIRYRINGLLIEPRCYHCSRRRKAFSGSGSAYAEVTANEFPWLRGEADLAIYSSTKRFSLGFCRLCGSTLCGLLDGEIHGITLGTLDGEPGVVIEKHIFVGFKIDWDIIGDKAPQFPADAL
jgi:hypothetical protein